MSSKTPPFDPNELADWLVQGFKETLSYRLKNVLDREKWAELVKSKIPNKNQVIHLALKKAFQQAGFKFEELKQGDAVFFILRKTLREVPEGHAVRRFVLVPGFGDSPATWLASFAFANRELSKRFDEILVIDFPGYSGFLAKHELVASMTILLSVVKTVCEANPPSVLVGHSLGGWLAGRVAQNLKVPMDHLILIAPSGLIPEFERKAFGEFIVNNQALSAEDLLSLIVHEPKKYHEFVRDEIRTFYSQKGVKDFVESVARDQFINPSLPFSARKLTVLWGENDRFVPSQWIRFWVENYGEYLDAYLIKDTGHIPQMESPRTMVQVIFHAITGRAGNSGSKWKKIQNRRKEFRFDAKLTHSARLLT